MKHCAILTATLMLAFSPFTTIEGQGGQKKAPSSPTTQANEAFQQMYWCYVGMRDSSPLTEEEYDIYQKISRSEFDRLESQVIKYPVFVNLYDHMRVSLQGKGNPLLACRHLRDALSDYKMIDELPLQKARAKKNSYKELFGIDQKFILSFYQSETAKSLGLAQGKTCPNKDPDPDPVPDPVPDQEDNLKESPIEKLEKLLSRGLVDSFIEIRQLVKGDGRIIPGQDGIPYDVKFKNAKTKEVLYFDGGKYVIEDDSDNKSDSQSRWKAFSPAIQSFSELVVGIMQEYGNSAYNVFVQGSADAVTFQPKSFHSLYNDPSFHTIPLLKVDKDRKGVKRETVEVGDTYTNPPLPQLRAAFVKECLLFNQRLSTLPKKVTIVEGSVKPYTDIEKRNCSIILYIDWEKAKKKNNKTNPKT